MPYFEHLTKSMQAQVRSLEACFENDGVDTAKRTETYRKLGKSEVICGALTPRHKRVCLEKPWVKEDGSTNGRCRYHGGKSTGAKTAEGKKKAIANLRTRTPVHGLYSENFLETLTDEELAFMDFMERSAKETYVIEGALEEFALQALIMEAVRHFRIVNTKFEKESKNASEFITKYMRLLENQGWRRKDQESKGKGASGALANLMRELDKETSESSQFEDEEDENELH
ncbi:hypothetical protein DXT76_01105 [Halobacillus trueperi]|uniref:Terminase small subunit n=1 Tax=Halobacillus trueperi TaxID=156205 RepID=A0A3D8VU97_9BACI|nr:HGGxSTG domain-containing protein [Halobacillus trueperi]RDY72568.1 hypothetical protein DXT76_01105 [Halobacillus trueperi]